MELAARCRLLPEATIRSTDAARIAASAAIGVGVPLCGFTPVNHAADVFEIEDAVWRVILMPPVVVAIIALATAVAFPARKAPRIPTAVAAGGLLLIAGAAISLAGSANPTMTALTAVIAVSSPILLVVALLHANVHWEVLMAAFLATVALLLVRADVVFLVDSGIPSPSTLFDTKFRNSAYDFHYYTLGNPDHTAGFLLMPMGVALFWALQRAIPRPVRYLLFATLVLTVGTLVLTYARSAVVVGGLLLFVAIAIAPITGRRKLALQVVLGCLALGFLVAAGGYLADLIDTSPSASVPERLTSLREGLRVLAEHPFTGIGLAQHNVGGGYLAAHSSVVQAAAEMGVLGLSAMLLLTGGITWNAWRIVVTNGSSGLRPAAAIALAVYTAYAAVAAPANEGLYSSYVAVWGLTAALLLAASLSSRADPVR